MTRFSSRCRPALLVLGIVGCAGSGGSPNVGAKIAENRPPGIAIDPVTQTPPRRERGYAEQGLVVLQEPRNLDAAKQCVDDFFQAVVEESESKLDRVLSSGAYIETGARGSRQRAHSHWRARFGQLDYTQLARHPLFRKSELFLYNAEQARQLSQVRGLGILPNSDQLLLRAPILISRLGRDRYFGEEIVFLLEPDGTRYQIVRMVEDFRLP